MYRPKVPVLKGISFGPPSATSRFKSRVVHFIRAVRLPVKTRLMQTRRNALGPAAGTSLRFSNGEFNIPAIMFKSHFF